MSLNLFPARVPIGRFQDEKGNQVDVLSTPEFVRALSALLERVGGADGADMASLALAASYQPAQMQSMLEQALSALESSRAEVVQLAQRIEGLEAQLQPAPAGTDWEHPGKLGDKTANSAMVTTLDASGNATLTTATASGQITSTVATGAPPFVIASTDEVANLHAALATLADYATTAGSLDGAGSYPADATDLATVITLANAIKARNISRGV
jgi:hypothetical protein